MTYNTDGLKYPENIYCDIKKFHEENQARCYYYHKVSTEMPENCNETMDYLLDNFFARRINLIGLIDSMYRRGKTMRASAEELHISSEEAEEKLKQFFRDILYFPRYNEIYSEGIK